MRLGRRLAAVITGAGMSLLAASTGAAAAARPKIPTSDNPAPATRLRVRPTEIVLSGDGSHYLGGSSPSSPIRWTSWGSGSAGATGDYWVTSLSGPDRRYPVTISLADPMMFHGQYVFGTLAFRFRRPNAIFARTQRFTVSYIAGSTADDGFYWG